MLHARQPLATPTHLAVGVTGDFGVFPAGGVFEVTLRADTDGDVGALRSALLRRVTQEAEALRVNAPFSIEVCVRARRVKLMRNMRACARPWHGMLFATCECEAVLMKRCCA